MRELKIFSVSGSEVEIMAPNECRPTLNGRGLVPGGLRRRIRLHADR